MNFNQFKDALESGENIILNYELIWLDEKTVKYECFEGCCEGDIGSIEEAWEKFKEDLEKEYNQKE